MAARVAKAPTTGRVVNALGQQEGAVSRWQLRREAKRQMYLTSNEPAQQIRSLSNSNDGTMPGGLQARCQRCLRTGHWTYECKNPPTYVSRPSRSALIKNPDKMLRPRLAPSDFFQEETVKCVESFKQASKHQRGIDCSIVLV